MTIRIDISDKAEQALRERAAAVGEDVSSYAARLLERAAEAPMTMQQISGPIGEAFEKSGMSEDALTDLLEKAKQEARARRRAS